MKYKIIKAKTTEELETLVNEHLGRGWRPFGDVGLFTVPAKAGTKAAAELLWVQVLTQS